MKEFWDARYAMPDYVYGTTPNAFFKEQLDRLPPGRLLLPAEGEGRNAAYAASKGWQVLAFDQSQAGREKAMRLAAARGLQYDYQVCDAAEAVFEPATFDALGLIFVHFPAESMTMLYRYFTSALKPGGIVLLEGFSTQQIAYQQRYASGGPSDPTMLFDKDYLQRIFAGFQIELLEETETELDEGAFHSGKAHVVRLAAKKPEN